ncbi:MAG: HPP family protein [Amphritea sp.]
MKATRLLAFKRLVSLLSSTNSASGGHRERWLSVVGGFIGIYALLWISGTVLDRQGATIVMASMGASAVLVFALPHGALAQPWAVFGGHITSALIGVSCAKLLDDPFFATAVAVALAIAVMSYLHCIHPPGGATAMIAVVGGEPVQQLGYGFVIYPVLINVMIILAIATVVNLPFNHRRYPKAFSGFSLSKASMDDKADSDLNKSA